MAYRVSFDPIDNPIDLTSGENTFPRQFATNFTAALGNQSVRWTYFTARRTETVNSVRTVCSAAAVGTTLARIGVYEVASNGNLTLIASTANDTALWSSATAYTKSLTAGFTKVRGQRYAVGLLVDGTSTAPQLMGLVSNGAENGQAPRLAGNLGSQADLPNTVSAGSIVNGGTMYYAALIP